MEKQNQKSKKDDLENIFTEYAEESVNDFLEDQSEQISKGDKNKDIRFNSNKNRQEIDMVTKENQLR